MSNQTSNQMCVCAHQRVTWRTEEIEKGVLGWWACTECQTVFVPMKSYEASLDVVNRLNAAEIERLRAQLKACGNVSDTRMGECERLRAALVPLVNAAETRELPTDRHTRQGRAALSRPAVETNEQR